MMNGTMNRQANIIGSNNNLEGSAHSTTPGILRPRRRQPEWIVAAFRRPRPRTSALVLSIQADMWDIKRA